MRSAIGACPFGDQGVGSWVWLLAHAYGKDALGTTGLFGSFPVVVERPRHEPNQGQVEQELVGVRRLIGAGLEAGEQLCDLGPQLPPGGHKEITEPHDGRREVCRPRMAQKVDLLIGEGVADIAVEQFLEAGVHRPFPFLAGVMRPASLRSRSIVIRLTGRWAWSRRAFARA